MNNISASVLLVLVLIGSFAVQSVTGCGVIVCEHRSAYITCPYPLTISVQAAVYGRSTDASVCPGDIKTTHCGSASSSLIVKKQCDGKCICKLTASNSIYGDPCVQTYKYLEVEYECTQAYA
ncbi:L-rhamnose-binding lectin ELEL-1-like [Mytilus trossulus]|uniref:L-rhamnose-binding lectin ELEL-1-like n=1 Tax=Mytilus trossulus TaxID=6551 RepID=UPI003005661A